MDPWTYNEASLQAGRPSYEAWPLLPERSPPPTLRVDEVKGPGSGEDGLSIGEIAGGVIGGAVILISSCVAGWLTIHPGVRRKTAKIQNGSASGNPELKI
jgi:hypothetical protein